jgi:hypothetical protein
MAAVTELVDRLNMIKLLDASIGPIKVRDRGCTGGELLVGVVTAQSAREASWWAWIASPPTQGAGARAGGGIECFVVLWSLHAGWRSLSCSSETIRLAGRVASRGGLDPSEERGRACKAFSAPTTHQRQHVRWLVGHGVRSRLVE